MPAAAEPRRGIACAANWIVDHVKLAELLALGQRFPERPPPSEVSA